ncbi:hypothetical protein ABPG74_000534 [Tetrahymena malaccensis]
MDMKLIFLLISILTISLSKVDKKRVILVDQIGQNLLFRTNSPADPDNKTYELDTLFSYMKQVAEANNIQFPQNFTVDAYSLLNIFEPSHRSPEIEYFKEHPSYKLYHKVIIGNFISPLHYPAFVRKFMAETYGYWNFDQLQKLVQRMHDNLAQQEEIPKIIFFHCVAGEDRTGEVFGAYKMYINGWNYQQALDFDNHVMDRNIKKMSENGMNWFCWYLKYVHNMEDDCDYES